MTKHRPSERDTERLRRFFAEVHEADRTPSFRRMSRPDEASGRQPAAWRPAFAVVAVVLMAVGVAWLVPALYSPGSGPLSESRQLALARDLSSFEAPLDFLLETPGREILYAPPSFELMEITIPRSADPKPLFGEKKP